MRRTLYLTVPLILLTAGFGSSLVGALDLEEALNLASGSADARLAVLQEESAAASLSASSYPGDTSLSIAPAYKRVSDELAGMSKNDAISVDLSVSMPLGLDSSARDKMKQAAIQAELVEASLPWNLQQTRLKAFSLYAAAWAAQEEAGLAILNSYLPKQMSEKEVFEYLEILHAFDEIESEALNEKI